MPATTPLILRNASVLDTRAGSIVGRRDVVIEAGRIVEVADTAAPRADATEIDLGGRTLMPGLCDGHVHVIASTASFPQLLTWSPLYTGARAGELLLNMLDRGFTTVRDCGGADFGLARAVDEGLVAGPRILFAGHAISQTGGHGDMRGPGENWDECCCCAGLGVIADGVPAVRKACREEIRKGAHFIKIMASGGVASPTDRISSTQFAEEEVAAAVEEAEAAELYVSAHVYTARAANRVLRLGGRSIEHGNLIDGETMDLLIEKDAFLVPTMSTYQALATEGVEAGMPADMVVKVHDVLEAGLVTHTKAHARGVKMVFGTDLLGTMQRHQLNEFSIRGAFQSPAEMIRSATVNAAELFNEVGETGEIVVGARGDMIALDGDPLDDIGVLQDPDRYLKLIVKDGQVHKNAL
jgi:imidazolonepropionase-like amidohydrolase